MKFGIVQYERLGQAMECLFRLGEDYNNCYDKGMKIILERRKDDTMEWIRIFIDRKVDRAYDGEIV